MATNLMDRRIAFESTQVLKDCCLGVLAETRPKFFGAVSKCTICDNRFKTVEADAFPVESSSGKFSEVFASRSGNASPISVKVLVLTKKKFPTESAAKKWAQDNGFTASLVQQTKESWTLRQAPEGWFAPQVSPRSLRLMDGVLAEIGVRKPEMKAKKASTKDLLEPMRAPKPSAAEKDLPDWVLPEADGKSPSTKHKIKFGGKYWTLKAAAAGFVDKTKKAMHEKPVEEEPVEEKPTGADGDSIAVPSDGKCPEGYIKRGDMCVKFGKSEKEAPAVAV